MDEGRLGSNLKYIPIGRQENGESLFGANRLTGGAYDKGYFVEPLVFADVIWTQLAEPTLKLQK